MFAPGTTRAVKLLHRPIFIEPGTIQILVSVRLAKIIELTFLKNANVFDFLVQYGNNIKLSRN